MKKRITLREIRELFKVDLKYMTAKMEIPEMATLENMPLANSIVCLLYLEAVVSARLSRLSVKNYGILTNAELKNYQQLAKHLGQGHYNMGNAIQAIEDLIASHRRIAIELKRKTKRRKNSS